jgi:hypothetical protein
MEWKLPNAKSRDVERQHLNKILQEIRSAITSATTTARTPTATTTEVVTRYAVADFMLTLTGDVTGSAEVNGLGDVTLTTTIDSSSFLTDAPSDNQPYWRYNGTWQPVSQTIMQLQDTDGLPEGIENLYFTDERAQDAVAAALTDSTSVTWAYDDVANTITATTTSAPNYASFENGDLIPLTRGMVVCVIGGQMYRATALPARHEAIGYVDEDLVAIGATGRVQTDGIFTTTALMWDDATGMVGGLATEQPYFLTDTGDIQPWPSITPGNYIAPVGYALDNTSMRIEFNTQILI